MIWFSDTRGLVPGIAGSPLFLLMTAVQYSLFRLPFSLEEIVTCLLIETERLMR